MPPFGDERQHRRQRGLVQIAESTGQGKVQGKEKAEENGDVSELPQRLGAFSIKKKSKRRGKADTRYQGREPIAEGHKNF